MVKKIVLWILIIACMGMIFCFSAQEATDSRDLSDGLLFDILKFLGLAADEKLLGFLSVFIRKTAHFSVYALLGGLICTLMKAGYDKKGKMCVVVPVTASALYAVTDEIHQLFVEGRSGEARDVLLDTSGALFGTLIVIGVFVVLARRKKND